MPLCLFVKPGSLGEGSLLCLDMRTILTMISIYSHGSETKDYLVYVEFVDLSGVHDDCDC